MINAPKTLSAIAVTLMLGSGAFATASATPFENRQVLAAYDQDGDFGAPANTAGFHNGSIGLSLNRVGSGPFPSNHDLFPCNHTTAGCGGDPNLPNIPESEVLDELSRIGTLGNWLDLGRTAEIGDLTGTGWSATAGDIPILPVNHEDAIIYVIDIGVASWTEVELRVGSDNGAFVWLNGEYIFGAMAPGHSNRWEYTFLLDDLAAGTHYLQVLREDHGGSSDFDLELRGTPVEAPEPTALALLGLGIVGLGVAHRRRRNGR